MWFTSIFVAFWTLDALKSHSAWVKGVVLGIGVTANFLGTWLGTGTGARIMKVPMKMVRRGA